MGFKLGDESRKIRMPNKSNTPIYRKDLEGSTMAEANNDGSIFISKDLSPKSPQFKKVIRHELKHKEDMENGRAAYGDEWVMWEGDIFFRKTIDGENVIDGPAGRLPEGHPDHPWEQSAIQAENDKSYGI